MVDVIRDTFLAIISWVLEREPSGNETFKLLILLIATIGLSRLTLRWRNIAYRSHTMRRKLLPNERYAGRYLQAVLHYKDVRYTIVNIFFNSAKNRFEVAGRVYKVDGRLLSTFGSVYVLFPSDTDNNIEFIWQGRSAFSANSVGGYTKMTVDAVDDEYIEGVGVVMNFEEETKIYPLRFKHLNDRMVTQALGHGSPRNAGEEPGFIKKFHSMYGEGAKEGLIAQNRAAQPAFALASFLEKLA